MIEKLYFDKIAGNPPLPDLREIFATPDPTLFEGVVEHADQVLKMPGLSAARREQVEGIRGLAQVLAAPSPPTPPVKPAAIEFPPDVNEWLNDLAECQKCHEVGVRFPMMGYADQTGVYHVHCGGKLVAAADKPILVPATCGG